MYLRCLYVVSCLALLQFCFPSFTIAVRHECRQACLSTEYCKAILLYTCNKLKNDPFSRKISVRRNIASCVFRHSKRVSCLKTTCPCSGLKTPSEVGAGKPKHPLITIIDYSKVHVVDAPESARFVCEFYSINFKSHCSLRYGRQFFDHKEGTLLCTAPEQVLTMEKTERVNDVEGWGLFFHPEFIRNAVVASIIIWVLAYLINNVSLAVYGFMPVRLAIIGSIWGLLELLLASIIASRLHDRKIKVT